MAVIDNASQLLMEAYKVTNGNLDRTYHVTKAVSTLSLSESDIHTALSYLTDRRLLERRGIYNVVSLTVAGIDLFEHQYPNPEREADRLKLLHESFVLAERNPRVLLNFRTVGNDLGWQQEQTTIALRYLVVKGLLKFNGGNGNYSITTRCIELFERVHVDPNRLTDYFPPSATLSINIRDSFNQATLVGSNIGSPFATITAAPTEVTMGDTYKGEQVGAMGPNAHAHSMTFNQIWNNGQGQIDLPALATELSQLRTAVKVEPSAPDGDAADRAVGVLLSAEDAAKQGDGPKALGHLSSLGKWVLDVASKIGVEVAAKAIGMSVGAA